MNTLSVAGQFVETTVLDELANGLAVTQRPALAARLGSAFVGDRLSERERQVAIAIFRCLAGDTEIEVRRMLAEQIKSSPLLPHCLALKLAQDVEAVALPILENSFVLTDEDLLSIIRSGNVIKQRAIARRDLLSEAVSDALVDTRRKDVVEELLANEGADIAEDSYAKLLDAFADDPEIQELLVDRPMLPFDIRYRLVLLVSGDLQARLIEEHAFPSTLADQLIRHGHERALAHSLLAETDPQAIDVAALRLHKNGELTATLLLRTLWLGQLQFFGAAMAALARTPSAKAQENLQRNGSAALRELYAKSGLPAQLQKAFQVILEAVLQARRSETAPPQDKQDRRIVQELVQSYRRVSPDAPDNVIFQLGRLGSEG